jgi:cyclic pyranopterin phosphate synthase
MESILILPLPWRERIRGEGESYAIGLFSRRAERMTPAPLTDGNNRPIRYIRVSVTDRCNLRCRYCTPSADFVSLLHSQVLSYEEMERVIRILAPHGINSVRLTGGEPLVRKHLQRLVRGLSSIPGVDDLSLTTNGLLLEKTADELKRSGLSRVNVSMDTLKEDRFQWITDPQGIRQSEDLSCVMDGLREAYRVGLTPVKINVVLMKGFNDDELEQFVELTRENDFEVRFIEFMPMGPNGFWNEDRVIPADEAIIRLRRQYSELEPLGRGKGSGPATRYRIPGHTGTIGFITPISSHFCVQCNRIRLTADGKLRTCLFSDQEIDLIPLLRGNAGDEEIFDVIRAAVQEKPHGHEIATKGSSVSCVRTMSHIGG